jgi:hypothetical protein
MALLRIDRAVGHVDRVRPVVTVEPDRVPGHTQLCPELQRLGQRPTGKRCARDTGGESQIVLDPGARSGLAPGSEGLHDAHVQAFRGRIHGGGQARRTRANDQQVVHAIVGGRRVEAEAFSDVAIAGVLQKFAASAYHHGNVLAAHVKALEQRLGVGIVLDVDIHVGAGVTRQELA